MIIKHKSSSIWFAAEYSTWLNSMNALMQNLSWFQRYYCKTWLICMKKFLTWTSMLPRNADRDPFLGPEIFGFQNFVERKVRSLDFPASGLVELEPLGRRLIKNTPSLGWFWGKIENITLSMSVVLSCDLKIAGCGRGQ